MQISQRIRFDSKVLVEQVTSIGQCHHSIPNAVFGRYKKTPHPIKNEAFSMEPMSGLEPLTCSLRIRGDDGDNASE